MRRLITYLNALFLGLILGMIFVALLHARPPASHKTLHISGITIHCEQSKGLK